MIEAYSVSRYGGPDGRALEARTYFTKEKDAKAYAKAFDKSDYLQSRHVSGPIKVAESFDESEAATVKIPWY